MKTKPLKRVVGVTFLSCKYNRRGEGCIKHVLECGHEVYNKASDGMPRRKRCSDCKE